MTTRARAGQAGRDSGSGRDGQDRAPAPTPTPPPAPLPAPSVSGDWSDALRAVPRAHFLPDRIWPWDMDTGTATPADRRTDPLAWRRWAEADVPIVTQWDDGRHTGDGPGQVPTSSSTTPHLVAAMLDALNAEPGMRVLEIGTGTGWTTALLAHRLGGRNVTSVEIDPDLAETARARLRAAGHHPTVLTADGTGIGHGPSSGPGPGPYDRILSTVALRRVPPHLVAQLRPGGLLLAPWGTDYSHQDALLRLTGHADGTASGPFLRPLEFMKARGQRTPDPRTEDYAPADWSAAGPPATTRLAPQDLGTAPFAPARWALGLALPRTAHRLGRPCPGAHSGWWYSLTDRSWAAASWQPDAPAKIWQGGPRKLWDQVESAWHWWDGNGRPAHDRYGLTVAPDGTHHPWLDTPDRPLPATH
ncbi:rRNA adenine N-6-methyltransferase family protein [Streptomyces sp. NPDC048172]|uniref:rRNA adenine N-6-methyltransferase family protein n=1 Tax=Streptomyces sp. NPDC048172 TaxID=3365505 RepID=UPI003712C02A